MGLPPGASPTPPRLTSTRRVLALAIPGLGMLLSLGAGLGDSLVVDEIAHIGAGYSYVRRQDMRLNPEHPPLAKDLAGLALLPLGLQEDAFLEPPWTDHVNGQWRFGRRLIFWTGNSAERIRIVARLPLLLFLVPGGWLAFRWSAERGGLPGAFLGLTLFSLSPTVLAHSHYVTTDVPVTVAALLSLYALVCWLRRPSGRRLVLAGLALGLALLTKFSALLLLPHALLVTAGCLLADRGRPGRPAPAGRLLGLAGVLGCALLVVWAGYACHVWGYPAERHRRHTVEILEWLGMPAASRWLPPLTEVPGLRPLAHYALGVLLVSSRVAAPTEVYFRGEVHQRGPRAYFPTVYAVKETLPWLALLGLAAALALRRLLGRREAETGGERLGEVSLVAWIAIYGAAAVAGNLQIGVRHLLPAHGAAIVLASSVLGRHLGSVGGATGRRRPALRALVAGLALWHGVEAVRAYPGYLGYFNQLAGGTSGGHRFVVDSNLDWGQDLLRLVRWLRRRGIERIELDYFGEAEPAYWLGRGYLPVAGTDYEGRSDFERRNRSGGWLAVSLTRLETSPGTPARPRERSWKWLERCEPVTTAGTSIRVYHLAAGEPVDR